MSLSLLKKALIALGIFILLLTFLKVFGHVKYGFGIFVSGILMLLAGILIPNKFAGRNSNQDNLIQVSAYPDILQSFGITVGVILLGLCLSPIKLWLDKFIGEEATMFIWYLLSSGLAFIIFFIIRKYKTGEGSFKLKIENKRIIPFISLASVALLFGIAGPISGLIPMSETVKKLFLEFASQTGIYSFILMVIAAPILEELIFRGIILDGLLKRYTPSTAILISSLLFGIVHLNPWQFVIALIIGIFSGWIYYKTRSITYSVIIHAVCNLTGFFMRQFINIESVVNKPYLESYGGLRNLILLIIGSVIAISVSFYYLSIEFNKQENNNGSQQRLKNCDAIVKESTN